MTMSIRRMTLGSGYKYLMNSVAQSDGASQQASALTRYYAESGTPPGRFLGDGLAGLDSGNGVKPGSQVTEEHLFRMLGMLQDPLTGEQLGRPPRRPAASYSDRVANRIARELAGSAARSARRRSSTSSATSASRRQECPAQSRDSTSPSAHPRA